ncbi:PREDICTED: forkhead box protein N3-like [Nanorana parkeri]|uniref:forkhead box protein N3-like n=1 Tax=Nanorana parkeri TaxID=125878 RepID=UPI000854BB50|nr:PREDICTED: forkhead box protein N3-like [Nanorana parkeri]
MGEPQITNTSDPSISFPISLDHQYNEKTAQPSIGKGSLWCIDPEYRQNLIQALKKTPYHPYSHVFNTPPTSPQAYQSTSVPPLWPGSGLFKKNGALLQGSDIAAAASAMMLLNSPHDLHAGSHHPCHCSAVVVLIVARLHSVIIWMADSVCVSVTGKELLVNYSGTAVTAPGIPGKNFNILISRSRSGKTRQQTDSRRRWRFVLQLAVRRDFVLSRIPRSSGNGIINCRMRTESEPSCGSPLVSSDPKEDHNYSSAKSASKRSSSSASDSVSSSSADDHFEFTAKVCRDGSDVSLQSHESHSETEEDDKKQAKKEARETLSDSGYSSQHKKKQHLLKVRRIPSDALPLKKRRTEKPPESDDEEMKEAAGSLLHLAGIRSCLNNITNRTAKGQKEQKDKETAKN